MPRQTIKPVAVIVLWEPKNREPITINQKLLASLRENGIDHIALLPLCPHKPVSMAETQFIPFPGDVMRDGIGPLQNNLKDAKFILVNNYVEKLNQGMNQDNNDGEMIATLRQDAENQNHVYRYIILDGLKVFNFDQEESDLSGAQRMVQTDMNIAVAAKALRLRVACENYLNHLSQPKPDANIKLTQDKQEIVRALLEHAKTSTPESLQAFGELLKEKQPIIEARRDSYTRIFLKVLLSIFTFGIAVACGLWKKEGETVAQELNSTLSLGNRG